MANISISNFVAALLAAGIVVSVASDIAQACLLGLAITADLAALRGQRLAQRHGSATKR